MLGACDLMPNDLTVETSQRSEKSPQIETSQASQEHLVAGILPVESKPGEGKLDVRQMDEIIFYLQNNTEKSVQVLPWNTPLEKFLSADLFSVTVDGEQLSYVGRAVKRAAPEADDYISLAAGERRESLVVLSQGYDLSRTGEYRIALESLSLLDTVGELNVVIVDTTVIFTNPSR